jgi:ADP-heptose:LPS heptosyltransferase
MPEPAGIVLLANARREKGFDLFSEAARRLPDIAFLAIDSQPGGAARPLDLPANLTVIGKTDCMDALYAKARVVAVPSYGVVETFSRVCVEAQRHGVPVIGSDVGNVPCLLADSGIVLPEDVGSWVREIERLYCDEAYFRRASRRARLNAARFSRDSQKHALTALMSNIEQPFLVGIGSGLGNMVHAGPLIRNLSRRLGRKVDLVVAEDHGSSLFVLHDPQFVNAVFALRSHVLCKRYEVVFLTHSFGETPVVFNAAKVIASRSWSQFHADHEHHETVYNLEATKALFDIPYDADDIRQHYVGGLRYDWPGGKLVGLHAGSKGGTWVIKRWPRYAELAGRLIENGYRVASFGIPDEYVEGTEDRTGGSIEAMASQMRECSYFISNDSGVMNVANALGIPLIALFAPTNARTRGPLGPASLCIGAATECAPCEIKDPQRFAAGTCPCIGTITVDRVWEAFEQLVERQSGRVPEEA